MSATPPGTPARDVTCLRLEVKHLRVLEGMDRIEWRTSAEMRRFLMDPLMQPHELVGALRDLTSWGLARMNDDGLWGLTLAGERILFRNRWRL